MSNLVFRPFEERDADGYWHTRDMTYNNGEATPVENRVFKTTRAFVGELDGRVVACFNVLDLACTRGDRGLLKCAGVAGVAVLPEFRHLGIGSKMMSWSIPALRKEGYHVASLYGFRETFYRKFGYEMCGNRLLISCPTHRLPRLKPELPVRKVAVGDFKELQACHETFAGRYGGMNVRTEKHWGRVLDEKKAIYAVGDPIEAYAIVGHSVDFWVPQYVNEMAWTTAAGYRSILAVMSQICINKSGLETFEPSDSPFLASFMDQGVDVKSTRLIMYRLLDVPGALSALGPVGAGAFTVTVRDELVPENNGAWRVTDDGEAVGVERGEGGLEADIQTWTQAYLGEPGLDQLKFVDQSPADLRAAKLFLPPMPVYCQEFF